MYITQVSRIPRAAGDILLIIDNYGKLYFSKTALNSLDGIGPESGVTVPAINIHAVEIKVKVYPLDKPKATPKPGPGKKRN